MGGGSNSLSWKGYDDIDRHTFVTVKVTEKYFPLVFVPIQDILKGIIR